MSTEKWFSWTVAVLLSLAAVALCYAALIDSFVFLGHAVGIIK